MMLFRATIAGFLLGSLAQGSPVPTERNNIGGVLICNGPNGKGNCKYAVYELEKCYNLPPEFAKGAATFAPDNAPFYCYPYIMECGGICMSPTGCTMGAVSSDYEHKYNLTEVGWNKYITSFECHLNKTSDAYSQ